MYCIRKVSDDLFYVGGDEHRLALFEGIYDVPKGISYNSYLLIDEDKTILFDTVDVSISKVFFENIHHVLNGRKLDYVIVHHVEPDHSGTLEELVYKYPEVTIICNQKTSEMLDQFFNLNHVNKMIVNENDTFKTAHHEFLFVHAKMVHWPEVMMTYDKVSKILFSADAFGTFNALNGALFADEVNFNEDYLPEARRYYCNIVGKYGPQVQAVLKKASTLDITMICPLHGLIWRGNLTDIFSKYQKWSTYSYEEEGVVIAYASIYGNTKNAALILANRLKELKIKVEVFDVSITHASYIISSIFRYSHLILASTTYNAKIFSKMEDLIHDIVNHNVQSRFVGLIENGSWAPTANHLMKDLLLKCKDMNFLDETITIHSSLNEQNNQQLTNLALKIKETLNKPVILTHNELENKIQPEALFKLSYGLFVLTTNYEGIDNGCIINTAQMITEKPRRIAISVNKANYTCELIQKSKKFNLSVLTTKVPFDVIKHFGFQSGREVNKFENQEVLRTQNNISYLNKYINAYISCNVEQMIEYETHIMFIGIVNEAKVINLDQSVTYEYYQEHIKVKPQIPQKGKTIYVCKVCGYVYEGEEMPDDYICPLCTHGKEDFEKVEVKEEKHSKQYVCKVCGYVYEGDELPDDYICPLCKHGKEDFEEIK